MKSWFARYTQITLALLAIDWILGALHGHRAISLWPFAILNFPFGLPHTCLEAHWTGTQYRIGSYVVPENWAWLTFFFAVAAQGCLFTVLFCTWLKRRRQPAT
jgi:hypothetical protein